MEKTYIAIDLKSFYASVECRERGLDPLDTNLVVADESRTDKTICLAVTPSLKEYGISGRARLFEARQQVKSANARRLRYTPGGRFIGSSYLRSELQSDPLLELDFIIARPRMGLYMDYSTRIYNIYCRYVAPEDIIVYSIDEVFMDVTGYLELSGLTAEEFAMRMILEVLQETGITATAGIGSNLYLCKVAMDIGAKHTKPDKNGVRMARLDEMSYRKTLWNHRPLTDFWRLGPGYAEKLEKNGMFTMGDVARCSVENEDILYRLFGKNAELLIDHAWGWEPCTVPDIKAYRPSTNSLCSGQVLHSPYEPEKARLVLREMLDLLALDLVDKGIVTDQLIITVGYDIENLTDEKRRVAYRGAVTEDHYGRRVPRHAHGTTNLGCHSASSRLICEAGLALYDRIADPTLLVRRMSITANHLIKEQDVSVETGCGQLDLFTDYEAEANKRGTDAAALEKEKCMQQAVLDIKKKFGKNAILKGMNFLDGATARDRNSQIGGHKA